MYKFLQFLYFPFSFLLKMLLELNFFLGLFRELALLNNLKSSAIFCCSENTCLKISKSLQNVSISTIAFNINFLEEFSFVEKSLINSPHIGVILDLDCEKSAEFLEEMSHRNKFNETFLWIIYTSVSHEDSLEILNGVKMQWDSEVFLAARDLGESADGVVKVSEVYRVKFDDFHPICVNFVGFWNGISLRVSEEFTKTTKISRRLDLQGTEIYGAVTVSIGSQFEILLLSQLFLADFSHTSWSDNP